MTVSELARDPARFLRFPWIRRQEHRLRGGRYRLHLYDQPGRWMGDPELAALQGTLRTVAADALDAVPDYGPFAGTREAFRHRVIGVVSAGGTGEPVAFTALVFLPIPLRGRIEPVLHLGLTMVRRGFRGQRLQGPLFEKLVYLPFLNQFRTRFVVTNIAASPAGIGAVADCFHDAFPHYAGRTRCRPFHREVAAQVLAGYRHEFGCAGSARFDPDSFVVRGSNDPAGGGAWQFLRDDPVSLYRREECNRYCRSLLRFSRGDELFQVARLDLLLGTLGILTRLGRRHADGRRADRSRHAA